MNKKVLALGLLSATAFSALGTTTAFAAQEANGSTNVTYEVGTTAPTDAKWAVSMPVRVTLNESNEAVGNDLTNKANSIYDNVGQSMDFTIYDRTGGTSSHTSGDVVKVTLQSTNTGGEINMSPAGQTKGTVKMALAKKKASGTGGDLVTGNADGNVGTLTNENQPGKHTLTLKAGITEAPDTLQKGDKFSTVLQFKFSK
ncbi:hypothetical protein WKT02_11670 [Erysipelotrichaceae bacterium HCN-30851]